MTVTYRKLRGEWVAFGPVEEIQPGPIEIQKRSGKVCPRIVERVEAYGQSHAVGYLAEDDDRPTSTYRERREARAERLREWSGKRAERADADAQHASSMAAVIPFGQPILVDHYSTGRDRRYRARIGATMDRAIEHARKAEDMAQRADTIEDQLRGSIYDDDADAVERLTEKLTQLEAQRERIKAYNRTARKGAPDVSLLGPRERRYVEDRPGPLPSYALTNLGGNITRTRQRLARLTR